LFWFPNRKAGSWSSVFILSFHFQFEKPKFFFHCKPKVEIPQGLEWYHEMSCFRELRPGPKQYAAIVVFVYMSGFVFTYACSKCQYCLSVNMQDPGVSSVPVDTSLHGSGSNVTVLTVRTYISLRSRNDRLAWGQGFKSANYSLATLGVLKYDFIVFA